MISSKNLRLVRREIEEEISYIKRNIVRCEETIQRLRTGKHPFPVGEMIDNTKKKMIEFQEKLNQLELKLDDFDKGSLNEEIKTEIDNNMKSIRTKSEQTKNKKLQQQNKVIEKKKDKPINHQYHQYNHYHTTEKQISYDEKNYFKNLNSIPDYMLKNLDNMENNLGYIWRDIWCLGSKPVRKNNDTLTLFEKKDGIHYVHVYKPKEYLLYEKDRNGNKKLIHKKTKK